jgi:20S proteasome alpha/beta subunit
MLSFRPQLILRKRSLSSSLLVLFLLLSAFNSFSQEPVHSAKNAPIRIKGSFVIAAVCKDGIIVASDSRGTLKDHQGRRIAYYDINQKIFPIGDKLIADTGYASLNDPKISFLSTLMSDFAASPNSRVAVDALPDSYFAYASNVLPASGAASARLQTLFFGGFKDGQPMLCMYQGETNRQTKCRLSGYLSSPGQTISRLENVGSLSFEQAAQIMRKTIDDYAAAVQPGSVGGPVVIRTITKATSDWLEKPPQWPNWQSFVDLAEDYKNDRIPFHLMPGVAKTQLDALIQDGAAWSRLGQQAPSSQEPRSDGPIIGSYDKNR